MPEKERATVPETERASLPEAERASLPDPELAAAQQTLLDWFDEHARDLPWRRPDATPWAVLVSEFMLQQTPVSRVLPVYAAWVDRWPTPAALADEPAGEAIRAWGRLGYPRRALRLHTSAVAITQRYGGEVPSTVEELRGLPGVGDYTAAAVAAFAFGRRAAVLDTNVRRVQARWWAGVEFPPPHVSVKERRRALDMLPEQEPTAARLSAALMELGALVCTAATPACPDCPVMNACAWRADGYPAYDGPPRRGQAWEGTDRQCRGRLMAVLRSSDEPVHHSRLVSAWPEDDQRDRCLAGLVSDGLAVAVGPEIYALP